jgi:putative sigma-54 modulation protein
MKISYTGKLELIPAKQRGKLEAKLQKLSKMLERRGEKEAHIVMTQERFLHKVEITVNAMGHKLVGIASDGDLAVAAFLAFEKLEKQILKLGARWRDTKRVRDKEADGAKASDNLQAVTASPKKAARERIRNIEAKALQALPTGPGPAATKPASRRVYRVNHSDGSKPMSLEEAMLEMEASQDYLVYRDAKTDRLMVLMRRPDGHFDLIES